MDKSFDKNNKTGLEIDWERADKMGARIIISFAHSEDGSVVSIFIHDKDRDEDKWIYVASTMREGLIGWILDPSSPLFSLPASCFADFEAFMDTGELPPFVEVKNDNK